MSEGNSTNLLSRKVIGHPDYTIRSDGQVWNDKQNRPLKWIINTNGYPYVNLNGKVHYLHRLVLVHFVGPYQKGMHGCHNDGNPLNPRLENLRWGTPRENAADRVRHGTAPRGEKCGAKLTEKQVVEIHEIINHGKRDDVIAGMFGVSPATIYNIRRGITWSWLTGRDGQSTRPKTKFTV